MKGDTLLFGRLTIGANRINLGRGNITVLSIRMAEQLASIRVTDEAVIQLEMSRSKLPDSTTFDKTAYYEQQVAAKISTDPNEESPFPGITLGRVVEVMSSPIYEAYAAICEPNKRLGLTIRDLERIKLAYESTFPDCAPHFPLWIE